MLTRLQGIENVAAVPRAEADAYVDLLRRGDGGRAFLKIMRGLADHIARLAQHATDRRSGLTARR